MGKKWTPADEEYLKEKWGETSIPGIAKKLNKSINAVKLKAGRLGLGRHLYSGEEITFLQLMTALGKRNNYGYCKDSWPKHGCPVKYKKSIKKKYMVIDVNDFWVWAQTHKNLLDFSRFERNVLGREPAWVPAKRKADILAKKFKTTPWMQMEDKQLIFLLNKYAYGYREISEMLCRTEGAIKRRIRDLGLKQRPVRADNNNPWSDEDIEKVKILHFLGNIPEIIAPEVNRSACAVRGMIERLAKKNELLPDIAIIEEQEKTKKAGVSYKKALTPELWPKAHLFVSFVGMAKTRTETGQRLEIDLGNLRDAFAGFERELSL